MVPPKPWAMTTHGRPRSPAKASPSPARCHPARVSPRLGKETSLRSGSCGLRCQDAPGELRSHSLLGSLAPRRDLARPDVVLVRVPLDLHRVAGAIRVVPGVDLLIAADRLL